MLLKCGLTIALKGERHYNSKLTDNIVVFIREKYIPKDKEYGCRAIARKLNVNHSIISECISGITWKHVN